LNRLGKIIYKVRPIQFHARPAIAALRWLAERSS